MRPRLSPRLRGSLVALALFLLAVSAIARPGGGSSYHGSGGGGGYHGGGSSHSSGGYSGGSGGSSGNGFAIFELVVLCIEHPLLGLFVLVVCGALYGMSVMQNRDRTDWSTTRSVEPGPYTPPAPAMSPRAQLASFRRFDPIFSVIVFEDFVYGLYAQVHAARGRGGLGPFSAYLSPEAIASLGALSPPGLTEVKTIIVGALHVTSASASSGPDATFRVSLEIEANYTEVAQSERGERAWYVRERWQMFRRATALSRTPDRTRLFACPSCGAPLEGVATAHCRYCNKDVSTGAFDWVVSAIQVLDRQARGPMLTAETQEEGTDDPTVVDPGADAAYRALMQKDPALQWPAFEARVALVFAEFQRAWAARDLAAMRPYLSDSLLEVETYWARAYQAQHLRNVTERARITRIDLARVTSDPFFDAITVRLFATSLDYTVSTDAGERLVCGSKSRERSYSEYWTFIRGAKAVGAPRADRNCPSCGAPLAINMAGHCNYCKAKITAGEFDWVLSQIEQDEPYGG